MPRVLRIFSRGFVDAERGAQLGEHFGQDANRDGLAVDHHAVAVQYQQLERRAAAKP